MILSEYLPPLLTALHFCLVVGISLRVIMRRPNPGVALAWMFIVAAFPYGGAFVYFLLGEKRIGGRRVRDISSQKLDYSELLENVITDDLTEVDWARHRPEAAGMNRLGLEMTGIPTLTGSTGKLLSDTGEILASIAQDVDSATESVLMQFYIWNEGGKADEVLEAVIRAAERGVSCLILVDSLGARSWWKGKQPARLRKAGVRLRESLPVGIFRTFIGRTDLRNHRKIVIIDGEIAYTGSMNMVDPRFFKQDSNVGEWVDAMVRIEGAAIIPLGLTMIGDWMLERSESVKDILSDSHLESIKKKGNADVQVIPTGPGETDDGLLLMLLSTINSAKRELVLTTPYFVPDESLLRALRGAAARGVEVHLILPEKVDSLLTRYASRSYYDELMDVGISIHLYRIGLLHTKSVTADGVVTMFGTANLDMRSLWINYEVSLFVYGSEFGQEVRDLQQQYMDDSEVLDPETWAGRAFSQKLCENIFRLTGPIL